MWIGGLILLILDGEDWPDASPPGDESDLLLAMLSTPLLPSKWEAELYSRCSTCDTSASCISMSSGTPVVLGAMMLRDGIFTIRLISSSRT